MENTRPSSLLPTIKCSNCAADIQITLITDHVCSVNGYMTPAEYTPTSDKMSTGMLVDLPYTTFFQMRPHTPSSILSSPESPGHLPFSNSAHSYSNTFSENLAPPDPLSLNKEHMRSELSYHRNVPFKIKSVEENEMNNSQSETGSDKEVNHTGAVVNPKSSDSNAFFWRVDKISPGPFDFNGKRDPLNNLEYDHHRKTSTSSLNDIITGRFAYDKLETYFPSAFGHYYKKSGGSINSKTNYLNPPKVPRKVGYDGFGPPSTDNYGTIKPRSISDSQSFLNNQSAFHSALKSNLELEIKISSSKDVNNKIRGVEFSESIFDPISTLSEEIDGRKKGDQVSMSPLPKDLEKPLLPPKDNYDKPLLEREQDIIGELPSLASQKNSYKSSLSSKLKSDKLPPIPPLSPLPPKENIGQIPSSAPQKYLNMPSVFLPKIELNRLPQLSQSLPPALKDNINEYRSSPPQNNLDNSPLQLLQNNFDKLLLFSSQQNLDERKNLGNNNDEKMQNSSLGKSNDGIDKKENPIFRFSGSNTPPQHHRKKSDQSQLENLMADIESSMSDLDLNERLSTRSSSPQISTPTTHKINKNSNNRPQSSKESGIITHQPSPISPKDLLQDINFVKNFRKKPELSKQNSLSFNSATVSSFDRVAHSGSSLDPLPKSRTLPLSDKPRFSKGKCKGCGDDIYGKSVLSADGRLTGRYHKECFVCKICQSPFKTASCYVINDAPYCEAHYHEINGSNCSTCNKGIEGKYVETERGQKHHPGCLRCSDCGYVLQNNYFEVNGLLYCKHDAYRRAKPNNHLNPNIDGNNSQMERGPSRLVMI